MKHDSTSSPKSSTDLTQPTREEGTMLYGPDDSPLKPLSTVSDDSANPGTKIDLNLNDPLCQRDEYKGIADLVKSSEEILREEGGPPESESWEDQDVEAFELSGKTGEEDNKNDDDLKDNFVAVPREIAVGAALTTHTEQPLQSSIHGNDEAAKRRTRIGLNVNEPPSQEDEDVAHQINLPNDITVYPSKKIMYPSADGGASNDCIKNSVEDNADLGKLVDKTNPPESESLEAHDAEAEKFEMSGKTREEEHNENVDDLNELGGKKMKGLKDNSVAVPQEIAVEAALAHSCKAAKKELAANLDYHLSRLDLILEQTKAVLEAIKKSSKP